MKAVRESTTEEVTYIYSINELVAPRWPHLGILRLELPTRPNVLSKESDLEWHMCSRSVARIIAFERPWKL
jgi:hypothetical protein